MQKVFHYDKATHQTFLCLIEVSIVISRGDIVFGDYKQDEDNCKLSKTQAKMGISCPRAYMIMPISFVLPHPEYYAFVLFFTESGIFIRNSNQIYKKATWIIIFKHFHFRFSVKDSVALVKFIRPIGSGEFLSLLLTNFILIITHSTLSDIPRS